MIEIQDAFAEMLSDVSRLTSRYEEIAEEFGTVRIELVVSDLEYVRAKAVRNGC